MYRSYLVPKVLFRYLIEIHGNLAAASNGRHDPVLVKTNFGTSIEAYYFKVKRFS